LQCYKKFRQDLRKKRRFTSPPLQYSPHLFPARESSRTQKIIFIDYSFALPSIDNYCCFSSCCVHFGGFFFAVFVFRFIKPFPSIYQNSYKKQKTKRITIKKHLLRLAFCAGNSSLLIVQTRNDSVRSQMDSRVLTLI
jgi:hypothetical protein